MRLDFLNFMLTGPSTSSQSVGKTTNGVIDGAGAALYTTATQCLTDTFTVSGPATGTNQPPTICGTNTGEHMYAEMEEGRCNTLDFQLGETGIEAQKEPNRGFNIKITQIECNSDIRAPQGCTQYFYGSNSQEVRSYNYNGGQGLHLASQNQNVCVRRERGMCKICWTAKDAKDVDTNGDNAIIKGTLGGDGQGNCCGYGTDGMAASGYDCIEIPGAAKGAMCEDFAAANMNANVFCGNEGGLAKTAAAVDGGTICSKSDPFNLQFLTDAFETDKETLIDAANDAQAGSGFQLTYFQSSDNC